MKNLRNGRPTGIPAAVGPARGRIVLSVPHADGAKSFFFHDGAKLYVLDPDGNLVTLIDAAGDVSVGNVRTNPASGQPFAEITVGDTPMKAKYNGTTWSVAERRVNLLDNLMVQPRAIQTVRYTFSPRKLRGTYSQGSTSLMSEDIELLTDDILQAVDALEASARVAGGVIHPRLAYAVAFDRFGNRVGSTLPVLITPDNPLTPTFTISVGADSMIGQISLSATAYTVQASWVNNERPEEISRIEIVTSEPFSPVDHKAPITCRRAGMSTSGPNFEIAIPGVQLGHSDNSRLREMILDGLRAMMSSSAVRCSICPRHCCLPDAARCRMEHRPGMTASNGTLGVTVAPRRMATTVFSPFNYALTNDPAPWNGSAATVYTYSGTDASRECVERREFSVPARRPLSLSPLIVVPDPDAATHYISVEGHGVALPMTAADGYSFYLAADFKPIDLAEAAAIALPAANPARERPALNAVVVVSTSDPTAPLVGTCLADGVEIYGVAPAARSRSTWDFGRARFYLMTSAGIYAMTVNSPRTRIDTSLVDSRRINSAAAVALGPPGVIVGAGKSLILLSGTAATELAALPSDPVALGWDNLRAELRIRCADGLARLTDSKFSVFAENDFNPTDFFSVDGRLYAVGSNTLYRVDSEEILRQLTEIEWEQYLDSPPGKIPVAICWNLFSSAVQGTFDLLGAAGSRLLRLSADGRIVAPLSVRLIAPRRARLKARISALVSPDTVISGVTVKFS